MAEKPETPAEFKDGRRLPFCQVDNNLICDPTIDPYAKLVYVLLCGYLSLKTFDCFPSHETICADLGISKPTAIKAVKALAERGILEIVKRRDKKGRVTSNAYIVKDWRSAQAPVQVNDVDSDACVKVNDVYELSKRRLPSSSVDRVNDVYTNDIDLDLINNNQVERVAAQAPKPEKTKRKTAKKESGDPRIKTVIDRIQVAFGAPYLGWYKQAGFIKKLLDAGYTEDEIVGCWLAIRAEKGTQEFIPLTWLFDRIEGYKQNGKLPQKGNGYGQSGKQATGRSREPAKDWGAGTDNSASFVKAANA